MQSVSYVELGGTLFIPASHKNLPLIVSGEKYRELKSIVIDFEDGLEEDAFADAMQTLDATLKLIASKRLLVFLRARDTQHLKTLLTLKHITKIKGFVLAKFSLENEEEYFQILQETNFFMMPSIEGEELFNHSKLHQLKEKILTHKQRVVLVRFGLEDMLRQLGMRRKCSESLFDRSATSAVIGNFIATFKSAGFAVSGGVYPCFKDAEGFEADVQRDLEEGLFSKTVIHPSQAEAINKLYKVSREEHQEAVEIVESQKVLFAQNGKMAETHTMKNYSQEILLRAKVYGVNS